MTDTNSEEGKKIELPEVDMPEKSAKPNVVGEGNVFTKDSLSDLESRNMMNLGVEITVSVGNAKMTILELLNLSRGAIVPLDKSIKDAIDIRVGDKIIAKGELNETDDGKLAVVLTEIVNKN